MFSLTGEEGPDVLVALLQAHGQALEHGVGGEGQDWRVTQISLYHFMFDFIITCKEFSQGSGFVVWRSFYKLLRAGEGLQRQLILVFNGAIAMFDVAKTKTSLV